MKILNLIHKRFNRLVFTGTCICGHNYHAHHGGVIMRRKCYSPRDMYGMIYLECEVGEINGEPTRDEPCSCNSYIDKGWVFMRLSRLIYKIHNP